jgi:hypothetical protein
MRERERERKCNNCWVASAILYLNRFEVTFRHIYFGNYLKLHKISVNQWQKCNNTNYRNILTKLTKYRTNRSEIV